MLVRFWKDTGLQRDTMTERQRWLVYGSVGAIALMIAGADEMLSTRHRHDRLGRDPGRGRLADPQHLARGAEHLSRPAACVRRPPHPGCRRAAALNCSASVTESLQ